MKYALILCDGMADYPVESLGGKTPLEAARTPNMDALAQTAQIGLVKTVPDGLAPGSDVANLGVLGFDARACYTGRSPLEALSIGIDMKADDLAMRTNLVTLSQDEPFEDKIMLDYSAGEISADEARELMNCVIDNLSSDKYKFYVGTSYRNCLIVAHAKAGNDLTPPHEISDRRIGEYLPKGELGKDLTAFIENSYELLKDHPVNQRRIARGENPANAIWFWGEGTKPSIPDFEDEYGKKGAMISAVDLLKGIAIGSGMDSIDVDGATGTLDTNFDGKAQAAIDALENGEDFCFVHIEATDECGHQGDAFGKVKAIELIDEKSCRRSCRILHKTARILQCSYFPTISRRCPCASIRTSPSRLCFSRRKRQVHTTLFAPKTRASKTALSTKRPQKKAAYISTNRGNLSTDFLYRITK